MSSSALKRMRHGGRDKSRDVVGPTDNPSTNIVMVDVAMRMGSYLMRRALERSMLKGRYGKHTARKIVKNKSIKQTIASMLIARLATGSLPGAAVVTTGMAAKVLLDRSKARQHAASEGDQELLEQARGE